MLKKFGILLMVMALVISRPAGMTYAEINTHIVIDDVTFVHAIANQELTLETNLEGDKYDWGYWDYETDKYYEVGNQKCITYNAGPVGNSVTLICTVYENEEIYDDDTGEFIGYEDSYIGTEEVNIDVLPFIAYAAGTDREDEKHISADAGDTVTLQADVLVSDGYQVTYDWWVYDDSTREYTRIDTSAQDTYTIDAYDPEKSYYALYIESDEYNKKTIRFCLGGNVTKSASCGEDLRGLFMKDGRVEVIGSDRAGKVMYEGAFQGEETIKCINIREGVETIEFDNFCFCTSLESITLPESLKEIQGSAFEECSSLKDVYYAGTEEQWKTIEIESWGNEALANANIHFLKCSHKPQLIAAKAATCTESGNIEYYECNACHKLFADESCTQEIKLEDTVLNATGHKWGEWKVVREATEDEEGLEERVCANDGTHKETRPIEKLTPAPMIKFTDVGDVSRYYYDPVYWAVEKGITNGYGGPNLFSPDANCSREQIVTFLWRMMGEPEPKKNASFKDVKPTDWYYKSVSWAAENGITVGLNDGTGRFGVGAPCTRAMCVTFFWRAAGQPAPKTHANFTDVVKGRYYYDAVSWAAENKITVGLNDGTGRFGVDNNCSRAMIVTFLYRYAQLGK